MAATSGHRASRSTSGSWIPTRTEHDDIVRRDGPLAADTFRPMASRGTIWYLKVPRTKKGGRAMRITAALDEVLATRGHVRILRALDGLPEGFAVSARDMARRAEVAHNRASEVLSALTEIGLAQVQRAGRADLYQLNRDHVMYPAVHELFQKEAAV